MKAEIGAAVDVREVTDPKVWDDFVAGVPDSTPMHRWAWRDIIEETYGHRSISLGAFTGSELRGVLPLVFMSGRLFGRRLVSMPYGDAAGPSAIDDDAVRALVEAAGERARAERASLDLRSVQQRPIQFPVSLEKVTMVLDLAQSATEQWNELPSERRNRIKKARASGLTAAVHGPEALDDFYPVFARNMRDLGSPVHSRAFFHAIMDCLPARLVVVRLGEQPVGAALMLRHRDTVSIPWVSSLREHFAKCPNQLLYWHAMEDAIAQGARALDFGRSSRGAGTFEAKRQWGARVVQLHWYYYPEHAVTAVDDAARFRWASTAWRRLPVSVANAIGPRVRGSIAN